MLPLRCLRGDLWGDAVTHTEGCLLWLILQPPTGRHALHIRADAHPDMRMADLLFTA